MIKTVQSGKQSVNLSAPAVTGSRIRRDPPPALKEIVIRDRDERNRRVVIMGVVMFTLALIVIAIGFSSVAGWSPRQYSVRL